MEAANIRQKSRLSFSPSHTLSLSHTHTLNFWDCDNTLVMHRYWDQQYSFLLQIFLKEPTQTQTQRKDPIYFVQIETLNQELFFYWHLLSTFLKAVSRFDFTVWNTQTTDVCKRFSNWMRNKKSLTLDWIFINRNFLTIFLNKTDVLDRLTEFTICVGWIFIFIVKNQADGNILQTFFFIFIECPSFLSFG